MQSPILPWNIEVPDEESGHPLERRNKFCGILAHESNYSCSTTRAWLVNTIFRIHWDTFGRCFHTAKRSTKGTSLSRLASGVFGAVSSASWSGLPVGNDQPDSSSALTWGDEHSRAVMLSGGCRVSCAEDATASGLASTTTSFTMYILLCVCLMGLLVIVAVYSVLSMLLSFVFCLKKKKKDCSKPLLSSCCYTFTPLSFMYNM